MNKLLSILIPTLPARIDQFSLLIKELTKQIAENNLQDQVQILADMDTREILVGEKRNNLLAKAVGQYICFIDDDDRISPHYIKKVFEGIRTGKDVITFCGEYHENGKKKADFVISTMVRFQNEEGGMLHRKPNHLCPVKRGIAISAQFPVKQVGEDSDYAERIGKMINNEYHMKDKLYFYHFFSDKTQTQNPNTNVTAYKN